jgi:hypothetical protein
MIRRNAEQDVALAASYEKKHAPEVIAKLLEASGARVREEWCAASYAPHPSGPEWYLRFRDWLLRGPPALTQ